MITKCPYGVPIDQLVDATHLLMFEATSKHCKLLLYPEWHAISSTANAKPLHLRGAFHSLISINPRASRLSDIQWRTMHEIVTLQLGQKSNYLATHFWNAQVFFEQPRPRPACD